VVTEEVLMSGQGFVADIGLSQPSLLGGNVKRSNRGGNDGTNAILLRIATSTNSAVHIQLLRDHRVSLFPSSFISTDPS